jgi:CopG family nickel-responsive transcriptional regulator
LTIVSITLPPDLLRRFEEFMKSRGYFSRSEAFRDAVKNLIAEFESSRMETGKIAATIMIISEHVSGSTNVRLSELRHEFEDIVIENIHRHIGHEYCLEIFIAEGDYPKIHDLVSRIRGMQDIQRVNVLFMPLKTVNELSAKK